MENVRGHDRLGPLPISVGPLTPISRARAALLERLRAEPGACTVEKLAAVTGQHQNTIREHLEALVEAGTVQRTRAAPSGRGRPAWLYRAAIDTSAAGGYQALADALASYIAQSRQPWAEGVRAGELWAKQLHDGRLPAVHDGEAAGDLDVGTDPAEAAALSARRRTVALLESVGFGVDSDPSWTTVRMTLCPLLQAARQTPQVVCAAHLGLVRGALSSMGADPDQADLLPFAVPGACLLHLGTRNRTP